MGLIFKDKLHDEFGTWPLAYIPYGGADFGEIPPSGVRSATGTTPPSTMPGSRPRQTGAAKHDACGPGTKGERPRAVPQSELFLWGVLPSALWNARRSSPGRGVPKADGRLRQGSRARRPVRRRRCASPSNAHALPAYFIPAVGYETAVRPLLICTNGYDATMTDMFFASAVAAAARGYHCLMFDGPGQGEMLIEHGMPLRPDWETVIKAVVDFALTLPLVDPSRIALTGWSLGGYLAPRAASGEHRLAACIADPGLWSMTSGLARVLRKARATGRSRGQSRGHGATAARQDVAGHLLGPKAAMDHRPARLLGERRGEPARVSALHRGVHARRPRRAHPLSDADHPCRGRPAGARARRTFSTRCGARRRSLASARPRAPATTAR